jgi:hypothetical protein
MPVPCDCCAFDTGLIQCGLSPQRFDAVAQTVPGAAGWSAPISLDLTIDGIINSVVLSGYNVAGNPPPAPTPTVEYTMTTARNLVRGVRLWNQGGGVLTDSDGLGPTTVVTLLDAANTVLFTGNLNAANGGAPFTTLIPGGGVANGVTTVRLSSLGKLSPSGVAPLWREFQLLQVVPLYRCRRRNGALEWYDTDGNLIPGTELVPCTAPALAPVANLTMNSAALGDDAGTGEQMCNVVPAPTSMTGFTPGAPGCFDPASASGASTFTWAGPVSGVAMQYASNGQPASGAALISFTAPAIGTIQWAANGVPMLPGETRQSLPLLGGGYAEFTYLAPGGGPAAGAPRFDGGPNIRMGPAVIQAFAPPYPFRIDVYA